MIFRAALPLALLVAFPANAEKSCDTSGLCCDDWAIDVLKRNGRPWGLVHGATIAAAQAKLEANRAFDQSWCRSLGKPSPCSEFNYENAGTPRCFGAAASTGAVDECGGKLQARLEALEKRFTAQTQRVTSSTQTIDLLRRGAGARVVRNPFDGLFWGLSSYGQSFNDGVARAQQLKKLLELDCLPAEVDKLGSATDKLFAGGHQNHQGSGTRAVMIFNQATELEKLVSVAPPELAFASLDVPNDRPRATLTRKKTPKESFIVFGDRGSPSEGPFTAALQLPLAFVRMRPGSLETSLGPVKVARTGQGDGQIIEVRAGNDGDEEVVEIALGPLDRDKDTFIDAEDRCPDHPGAHQGCPADSDGDGLHDGIDACPAAAGPSARQGCPEPPAVKPPATAGEWPVLFQQKDRPHLFGYLNPNGEGVAITPAFGMALPFSEGLAAVRWPETSYGFIDVKGNVVLQPQYINCGACKDCCRFQNGKAIVCDFYMRNCIYIDRNGTNLGPAQ